MYAWQSVCVYIRKRGQRKEPPPPSPPNPSEQVYLDHVWCPPNSRSRDRAALASSNITPGGEGYLQKTAEATGHHVGTYRESYRNKSSAISS
ncbi:Hypp8333 [Branchiostoma lanceolatum]|uniref:Hypp8333 protein n=1 Tax=Branchiostoma lanceolatum TaxID=7740 RepID=A0A8J9Z6H0_BRALA|nr:Hypp8333 [Branchiostoma lanceolatum]